MYIIQQQYSDSFDKKKLIPNMHFQMRSRISIRGYVRPLVRPSVRPSVTHELKPYDLVSHTCADIEAIVAHQSLFGIFWCYC